MGYKRLEILNREGDLYLDGILLGYACNIQIKIRRDFSCERIFINCTINKKIKLLKKIYKNALNKRLVLDLYPTKQSNEINKPLKIIFEASVICRFKAISERKTKIYIKFARERL